MSWSGFKNSSTERAGQGGDQPPRDDRQPLPLPSPAIGTDRKWEAAIRAAVANKNDREIQTAISRYFHNISPSQRPPTGLIIAQAAQLLGLAGGDLEPRRAMILMAEAGWSYPDAVAAYLAEKRMASSSPYTSSSGGEMSEESESSDQQSESSSEEEQNLDVEARMRLRNKGIDRAVAKRYQPDPSKTMIIIKRLDGKTDRIYQYGGPIDFNQPVRALNRWRSQIFRRHLGGSRPYRTHFMEEEKDFLLNEHINFEIQRQEAGQVIDYSAMKWGEITERFNRTFEGKILPGSDTPRPARTKVALRTERSRVKKITDHTGIASKNQKAVQIKPSSQADVAEDGSTKEEELKEDDPPSKSPSKSPEDDDNSRDGGAYQTSYVIVGP